jgi:phage FluMu protein Com
MDIALQVVPGPAPDASVLAPEKAVGLIGSEDENLLCGLCSAVLARGVSRATIRARFGVPSQLLIKCPHCSALNLLPAQVRPDLGA